MPIARSQASQRINNIWSAMRHIIDGCRGCIMCGAGRKPVLLCLAMRQGASYCEQCPENECSQQGSQNEGNIPKYIKIEVETVLYRLLTIWLHNLAVRAYLVLLSGNARVSRNATAAAKVSFYCSTSRIRHNFPRRTNIWINMCRRQRFANPTDQGNYNDIQKEEKEMNQ